MKVKCPHCETIQNAPDDADGKKAMCKACRGTFVITPHSIYPNTPLDNSTTPVAINRTAIWMTAICVVAVAWVFGFVCGAILTRPGRQRVNAEIARHTEIANQERRAHDAAEEKVSRFKALNADLRKRGEDQLAYIRNLENKLKSLSKKIASAESTKPSGETAPPRRQGEEVRTEKVVAKEETPSQKKVKSLKEFYIRIAFFNDTDIKPLSQNCRMWIRGFGDFYPARQRGWKFGGSLIEKAGPFDVNKKHTIYFYPDYSDEGREIKIPFKYSAGMNLEGSVRDMLSISVETDTIIFEGIPIKNATGRLTCEFNR